MSIVPKAIKFHYNLSEQEVRAYYSLRPLDEDYCLYEKRLSRTLDDYLNTKKFKTNNAKLCYKKQLKKMIKDGKQDTKKFEAFNMWRLSKIEQHISKCKSYRLELEGKEPMPKRKVKEADDNVPKINEYASKNNQLQLQIDELKKQLQEKDEIIKKQQEEIEKLKTSKIEMVVEESESESESEEEEVDYSSGEEEFCDEPQHESEAESEEEEVVEEDSSSSEEEDSSSSEEEEEEKIEKEPYDHRTFWRIRDIFKGECKKKAEPFYEKYMAEGKEMNDKERRKLKTKLVTDFIADVVEPNLEMIEMRFVVPNNVYEDLVYTGEEELTHKIVNYGFDDGE
jgi:hypothetical protein